MLFVSYLCGIHPLCLNHMAPGNMKSDILGLQRNKIVNKGVLSRKTLARIGGNVSTTRHHHQGSTVVAVIGGGAAAHVDCVQAAMMEDVVSPAASDTSTKAAVTGEQSPVFAKRHTDLVGDGDGEFMLDDGRVGADGHEVQHLKALSMLHLDVIEQQQEEIQRHEIELQKVRAQNDTLKSRLERIQRRTSLAQKNHEPLANHVLDSLVSPGESTNPHKRRSALDHTTPVKRQHTEKDTTPSRSPAPSPINGSGSAGRRKQLKFPTRQRAQERNGNETSRPAKERSPRKDGGGSTVREETAAADRGEQYSKTQVIYPCLSDLRVTDPDPALPVGKTVVQVPSWRINPLNSSSPTCAAENLEDIEDMTFERRHQKYEIAEQKRKRWDIQRLRELREHERLEQKMLRREYGNWDDVLKTFYPEPSDACQLQVSDSIPLVAFGVQVPVARDCEFELPWYNVEERDKGESRRQTRSRTNNRR